MGFWSSLKSAASKVLDIGKKAAVAAGNKLQEWGEQLSKKFDKATLSYAKTIGEESQYSVNNTRSIIDINTEISKYVKEIETIADEIEKKCIKECNSYYMDVIEFFENSNADIELSALHSYINETRESLNGLLKTLISKKVSTNNKECVAILELQPGADKIGKMEKFQKKVFKECLAEMCERINYVILKQNTFIKNHFDNISKAIENKHNTMMEDFENLENISKSNEDIKMQEILKHHMIVAYCDYILWDSKA
jgi:hypothetical protein